MVSINRTVKGRDDEPIHTALYFSYQCPEGAKPRVDGQHIQHNSILRSVCLGYHVVSMCNIDKVADIHVVPADMFVNAMIIFAWETANSHNTK